MFCRIKNISIVHLHVVNRINKGPDDILNDITSATDLLRESGMWQESDHLSPEQVEEILTSVMNRTNYDIHVLRASFILQVKHQIS